MTRAPLPATDPINHPAAQAVAMSLVSNAILHDPAVWILGLPGAIYYCVVLWRMLRPQRKKRKRRA